MCRGIESASLKLIADRSRSPLRVILFPKVQEDSRFVQGPQLGSSKVQGRFAHPSFWGPFVVLGGCGGSSVFTILAPSGAVRHESVLDLPNQVMASAG